MSDAVSSAGWPFVSVIIPCRNEARYIARCLDSIANNDYPAECREILVIDGMSGDGTRSILQQWTSRVAGLRVLDNPGGRTPVGLNVGLAESIGEVIIRVDAHGRYPQDYLRKLVTWLQGSGAANVGPVWNTLPGGDGFWAASIALALAHPFGVGNALFRIGSAAPRWVDTVPFGCYRRTTFAEVGVFDPELVRNQDDEFNARVRRHGGRVLLVPEIVVDYFARSSLQGLARQYYQYGLFKPLALKKGGVRPPVRQLAPALLVLGLLFGAGLSAWRGPVGLLVLAFLGALYVAAAVMASAVAWRTTRRGAVLGLPVVFAVLHLSYGAGMLIGLAKLLPRGPQTVAPTGAAPGRG